MVSSKEEAIEYLLAIADKVKEVAEFLGGATESPPEKALTLEEVRAELSKLSNAGKTSVVNEILAGVGAAKISDVDPKNYWILMAQAQEASHA